MNQTRRFETMIIIIIIESCPLVLWVCIVCPKTRIPVLMKGLMVELYERARAVNRKKAWGVSGK